jgi:hypothetical protein
MTKALSDPPREQSPSSSSSIDLSRLIGRPASQQPQSTHIVSQCDRSAARARQRREVQARAEARKAAKQAESVQKALQRQARKDAEARERDLRRQAKTKDSIARGSQASKEVTMVLSETLAQRLQKNKEGRAVLEALEEAGSGVQYVVEPGEVPQLATISWRRADLLCSVRFQLYTPSHAASTLTTIPECTSALLNIPKK